ncbi:HlyD family efflux transporter periplasmic adaptor subunit [Trinickia dinghuensis]|uniref:HlyD family efflux transporter periplasmic adaptor subunit n=1 Tax=Trinickia dinghuensis TaxID=2291023 RepID=A0A3D8JYN6_9BURK|nr:HlyD family efflux transporter periplasmic adaptor subunit [Trinickia dinghuensis]RDU97990.1 HlyD family efflux transporter periplasmic adaptor subunit [Trinickia dinghuensis]
MAVDLSGMPREDAVEAVRPGSDAAVAEADRAAAGNVAVEADAAGGVPPVALPPLREDLKLMPGPAGSDGSPTWTLHDPARHRYVRIGWLEFEVLARWALGHSDAVARSISAETTIRATSQDVVDVLSFLHRAGLTTPVDAGAAKRFAAERAAERLSPARWLLKNYLSIKVRLVNPDRVLSAVVPRIEWLFTRGFAVTLALLAVLAFYLITRQWDAYTHSLLHLFSLQGAALVGLALASAKVVHEIGHGVMAKRMGCRVPSMGVALIVLWPVLWTDTTDAWRLTDRRQRLAIDGAGMMAETTLAVFASLAWAVLPDGALRTGAFLLSSSTWLLTIAINVNPLMRFDGYFLLSDWLEVPNLQERGFAIGRWWMRETLFGLGDPPPEHFPRDKQRILIAYALACMVYRFTLFLGIALVVYHKAFKALGIFLMCVEIGWFLVRPIVGEIRIWHARLGSKRPDRRAVATIACCAVALLLFVVPWRREVSAPALMRAAKQATLYVAEPGRLVKQSANGAVVTAGQPIFELASPTVEYHKAVALATLAGVQSRMKGQAFDPEQADMIGVGEQELQGAIATVDQVAAQEALLTVRAPFAGVVTDVPPMREGEWLPRREALAMLIDPSSAAVEAFVGEADLPRVHPGAHARFFPENGDPPVDLVVSSVETTSARVLDVNELASVYGGGVAVRKGADNKLIPETAVYRAVLVPRDSGVKAWRRLRGQVDIEGDRASLLGQIYRRAIAVLISESQL